MDPIEAGQVPRAEKCDPNLEKKVRKKKERILLLSFSVC
jgi:predicted nucleic acid-binding Zn ribbon protein